MLCNTIWYKVHNNGSKNKCDKTEFKKSVDCNLVENLLNKFEFIIDLQKCENMCYEINCILSKYGYFLRIFKLKNKYHRLAVKDRNKQKIVTQLSSCLIEKYTGFTQISLKYKKSKESFLNQLI